VVRSEHIVTGTKKSWMQMNYEPDEKENFLSSTAEFDMGDIFVIINCDYITPTGETFLTLHALNSCHQSTQSA
jgi:hypothetical protein